MRRTPKDNHHDSDDSMLPIIFILGVIVTLFYIVILICLKKRQKRLSTVLEENQTSNQMTPQQITSLPNPTFPQNQTDSMQGEKNLNKNEKNCSEEHQGTNKNAHFTSPRRNPNEMCSIEILEEGISRRGNNISSNINEPISNMNGNGINSTFSDTPLGTPSHQPDKALFMTEEINRNMGRNSLIEGIDKASEDQVTPYNCNLNTDENISHRSTKELAHFLQRRASDDQNLAFKNSIVSGKVASEDEIPPDIKNRLFVKVEIKYEKTKIDLSNHKRNMSCKGFKSERSYIEDAQNSFLNSSQLSKKKSLKNSLGTNNLGENLEKSKKNNFQEPSNLKNLYELDSFYNAFLQNHIILKIFRNRSKNLTQISSLTLLYFCILITMMSCGLHVFNEDNNEDQKAQLSVLDIELSFLFGFASLIFIKCICEPAFTMYLKLAHTTPNSSQDENSDDQTVRGDIVAISDRRIHFFELNKRSTKHVIVKGLFLVIAIFILLSYYVICRFSFSVQKNVSLLWLYCFLISQILEITLYEVSFALFLYLCSKMVQNKKEKRSRPYLSNIRV